MPGKASPLERALLAFDSSPKAREALFVATYLAERWKTALTVVSIREKSGAAPGDLDYAREYLELHEVQADFVTADGPIDLVLKIVEERQINLVLMGGYGMSALEEVILGSAVGMMLRSMMKEQGIASLEELMGMARELGVKMTACTMSMDAMGIAKEELVGGLEYGGVAAFMADASRARVSLFI